MKFREVENKYRADEIPREAFNALVESFNPIRSLTIPRDVSRDYYFTSGTKFMRFRYSEGEWELTTKVKTEDTNNRVRTEVNVRLGDDMTPEKAEAFARVFGLKHDFTVSKDVQIFYFKDVVLSHYTTYDGEKKLDCFLEIEANETCSWESEEQALQAITDWEKKLSTLGLSPYKRIKKSLFEFYTTSP